jgi:putative transposase
MHDLIVLLVHLITTVLRLARPGGLRSVVAESVLIKHQLLIVNRSRSRAPNLRVWDRLIAGFCSLWIKPGRLMRAAIALKPSTLLHFHRALVQRKYQLLFSPKRRTKPGPKGPNPELIRAVVDMKQRNPTWGCPRIADQITLAFGIPINKDVVRRILSRYYRPEPDGGGPSWLTFLGHMKDSLWSVDLLRCESVALRTIGCWWWWISTHVASSDLEFKPESSMVRRFAACSITRFAVRPFRNIWVPITTRCIGFINGKRIWGSVLGVTEIETVPYVPLSHPFVERLIGTIRRECLDQLLFWTVPDLEVKLSDFKRYYNGYRVHASLERQTPISTPEAKGVNFKSYRWQNHCRGLYQTPIAAWARIRHAQVNKEQHDETRQTVAVHASTVKKSAAMIWAQCRRRNSFHVVLRFRSGADSMPLRFRMLAIVVRPTIWPRFAKAPWIRR